MLLTASKRGPGYDTLVPEFGEDSVAANGVENPDETASMTRAALARRVGC